MSNQEIERKRATNRLVRLIANYLFKKNHITPEQIYGLCKLTWLTRGKPNTSLDASYVRSTKIPALGYIFEADFESASINDISSYIAKKLKQPTHEVHAILFADTGFINYYNAYRNSSLDWINKNFVKLLPLFLDAWKLNNDSDGFALIKKISGFPLISKPGNNQNEQSSPSQLLTPVFFALDRTRRVPIINRRDNVIKILKNLKVYDKSLPEQYKAMITLMDSHGIEDAAELDSISLEKLEQIIKDKPFIVKGGPLQIKDTKGKDLPLKDEHDICVLLNARKIQQKKLHNKLTNYLSELFINRFKILEGGKKFAMYDALIEKFNGTNDLLIEVKSSIEMPHIRMAIGQLLDYSYRLKSTSNEKIYLAIVLPTEPDIYVKEFLSNLNIGILWFQNKHLKTSTEFLTILT